jgi:hypothetical protein
VSFCGVSVYVFHLLLGQEQLQLKELLAFLLHLPDLFQELPLEP